jgi:acyl carrier protein
MAETTASIQQIISDVCDIPRDSITPGVHLIDELGIDSVDFLDIVHEINKQYSISLPVEEWAEAVGKGEPSERYFILERLVENVEKFARS